MWDFSADTKRDYIEKIAVGTLFTGDDLPVSSGDAGAQLMAGKLK